jgi:WD40 repeat protein
VTDAGVEDVQIVRLSDVPFDTRVGRRGFLGSALSASAALGTMVTGCVKRPAPLDAPAEEALRRGCNELSHEGRVGALSFFARDTRLVSLAADGLKVWMCPSGALVHRFEDSQDTRALAVSPDGKVLVAGCADRISLWSLVDMKLIREFGQGSRSVQSVAISGDGRVLASGDDLETVTLWSLADGAQIRSFPTKQPSIDALALNRDGSKLVSASSSETAKLWDLAQHKLQTSVKVGAEVVVSGDAGRVASSSSDERGIACVQLACFVEGPSFRTDIGPVGGFAINDRHLAVVCHRVDLKEETIDLWSLADGKIVGTRRLINIPYGQVALSADSRQVATGDEDGSIKLWAVDGATPERCLMDLNVTPSNKRGLLYKTRNEYGQEIVYTLPCGSPIPPGAVCTCNCVPGTALPPPPPVRTYSPPSYAPPSFRGGGGYCQCNLVCTCQAVPICQAHMLLDPDPAVRTLAEQVLVRIDSREYDYFDWAMSHSHARLRRRINELAALLRQGRRPSSSPLVTSEDCGRYLEHGNSVVRIMAAQTLVLTHGASAETRARQSLVQGLLQLAHSRYWRRRI